MTLPLNPIALSRFNDRGYPDRISSACRRVIHGKAFQGSLGITTLGHSLVVLEVADHILNIFETGKEHPPDKKYH